ncbi:MULTISPECIES: methionine ABC transporter ATP-binding protein [Cutibacterium]|jgi:D-methionine transport system ATP-binding protein|uniref:Methionine ABC transporter ATP-binding protein n=4 Tax=Cutibacterium TaxID=1912216 RepID=A0A2B7I5Y0_CUTAC|nr:MULTISPECIES: methionine ABC transporter ATP-binding protein [Cutibacterium]EHC25869.1 methionine import ATP-binding protein MetN [Propionibacterium sp. 5_U_42AFAA]ERS18866.1 methionine import ATP-binding protein MetN [Propionibacterium sp. KPL2009]ERS28574.1 methionine import ATP-binding protein MetN [Propionibacterium sp. KPL2003]ERS31258.1 methionine import ATP-binding protein MetN [Propionibacterium sp. KPL1854]OFL29569.1 methionine ABC transporter ATP-binding protein [Propionibacterium
MATDITPSSAPQCPDHIVFEHVTKEFRTRSGTVRALDDVSLAIKRGSISAVIGHSGAGKSTLVRLINGLETPTRGRVLVDGTDVSQLSDKAMRPLRADIGMIFQQFNLFGSRTIYDNVAYPLKLAHWKKADEKKRVTELLSFVGLTSKAWDHPDQLSGGQKQRVGIARALATKPSILLADESTSALDPETTADVLSLLKRVNAELGVTVVVITHEMEVVRSIAQQVSVLAAGHLVESGSARQVFTHPQSETTQRFLATIIGQHPSGEEQARLQSENPDARLVDVSSVASHSFGDALARISRTGASFQIVHGGVIEVHDGSLGNYTVALSGPAQAVEQAARILDEVSNSAAPTASATVPTPTEEAH